MYVASSTEQPHEIPGSGSIHEGRSFVAKGVWGYNGYVTWSICDI